MSSNLDTTNIYVHSIIESDINAANKFDDFYSKIHYNNKQFEVNQTALDINGDGSVNNKDVTVMFRYLSFDGIIISETPYKP